MIPYPNLNASPRVGYTALELILNFLTIGNGDNKKWDWFGTLGLDMGMGDLGEPPVCEGFSNEVVLSRKGS